MKLLKNSKDLMLFFTKNKHINRVKQTKRTDSIITEIYNDIFNAYNYLNILKQKSKYYNVSIKKIENTSHISRPKNFNSNSFPELVRKHIDELSLSEITYNFSLYSRNITVHFIVEEENNELKIETFNKYIDTIIMWLYILNKYASKTCANNLVIYFYFTSLEKKFPNSNINILDQINVNTAFTTTCPKDSEIVVFRKEEWFKVFIHESIHNFGLDFSDMNNNEANNCILNIFKVNSEVNLYEAYTEFWAEIINALFCSFISLKDKNNIDEFLSNSEFFINFERTFSFFQLVKTLSFMGLTYTDLYSKSQHSKISRENLYKEKTNVLSYYVLKTILINNYQGLLFWCKTNNSSLLQFKKTITNQKEFCNFIEKNYKTSSMLNGVDDTQHFLNKLQKNKITKLNYILSNLRMSICELG
jgi:hypothetical protein